MLIPNLTSFVGIGYTVLHPHFFQFPLIPPSKIFSRQKCLKGVGRFNTDGGEKCTYTNILY